MSIDYREVYEQTRILKTTLKFHKGDHHNGVYHRSDGTMLWFKDNLIHNENGPAVIYKNGDVQWVQNNIVHRIGGPAIETKTSFTWYRWGKFHRLCGPAADNYLLNNASWYINDVRISSQNYKNFLMLHDLDIDNLTEEDELFIELSYKNGKIY